MRKLGGSGSSEGGFWGEDKEHRRPLLGPDVNDNSRPASEGVTPETSTASLPPSCLPPPYGSVTTAEDDVVVLLNADPKNRTFQLKKAAVMIDCAVSGKPTLSLDSPVALRAHRIYHNLAWLRYIVWIVLFLLPFFEEPYWCAFWADGGCHSARATEDRTWEDSRIPKLKPWVTQTIELVCMLILITQSMLWLVVLGPHRFFTLRHNLWHLLTVSFEIIIILQLFISLILAFAAPTVPIALVSPYLRPLLFCIRRSLKNILVMIVRVLDVASLIAIFVLLFSWIGLLLFKDMDDEYFGSFGATVAQLFDLLYAGNFPYIISTAYDKHRISIFFFLAFLLLGTYLLLNLALAVFYSSYRNLMHKDAARFLERRRFALMEAFNVLALLSPEHGPGCVSFEVAKALFRELNAYHHIASVPISQVNFVCDVLDRDKTGYIRKPEFLELCYVLNLRFQMRKDPSRGLFSSRFPDLHRLRVIRVLHTIVESRYFEYCVDLLVVLNCVCLIIEYQLHHAQQEIWEMAQIAFTVVYAGEIAIKVFVYGTRWFQKYMNRLDFFIVVAIVAAQLYELSHPDSIPSSTISLLMVLRSIRIIRILNRLPRFRAIIKTLVELMPTLTVLIGVLLAVYYIYAAVGIQIFGGQIYLENPRLANTDFASDDLFIHNFNDFGNAFLALFEVQIGMDWEEMDGWVHASGSLWSYVYLISFLAISDFVVVNIGVAYILDAYEYRGARPKKKSQKQQIYGRMAVDDARSEFKIKKARSMHGREYYGIFDLDHMYTRKMKQVRRMRTKKQAKAKRKARAKKKAAAFVDPERCQQLRQQQKQQQQKRSEKQKLRQKQRQKARRRKKAKKKYEMEAEAMKKAAEMGILLTLDEEEDEDEGTHSFDSLPPIPEEELGGSEDTIGKEDEEEGDEGTKEKDEQEDEGQWEEGKGEEEYEDEEEWEKEEKEYEDEEEEEWYKGDGEEEGEEGEEGEEEEEEYWEDEQDRGRLHARDDEDYEEEYYEDEDYEEEDEDERRRRLESVAESVGVDASLRERLRESLLRLERLDMEAEEYEDRGDSGSGAADGREEEEVGLGGEEEEEGEETSMRERESGGAPSLSHWHWEDDTTAPFSPSVAGRSAEEDSGGGSGGGRRRRRGGRRRQRNGASGPSGNRGVVDEMRDHQQQQTTSSTTSTTSQQQQRPQHQLQQQQQQRRLQQQEQRRQRERQRKKAAKRRARRNKAAAAAAATSSTSASSSATPNPNTTETSTSTQ
ncbi:Ion transport protein [Balamuthia mandrillaris]